MRNRLLFLVAFAFSFWFSYATFKFVLNFTPTNTIIHMALHLPQQKETVVAQPVYSEADMECLQKNIFFEARNQEPIGMAMVGIVTLQRTKMPQYPSTICGVVYQRWQFSWTAEKKHDINMKNAIEANAWRQSGEIARNLVKHANKLDVIYKDVAYYHKTTIYPKWANTMQREFVLQDHVFYSKAKDETLSFVLR